MNCPNCNNQQPIFRENGKMVACMDHKDVTLTLSKSDYNYIILTMGIEHGPEVVERIKAGVVK